MSSGSAGSTSTVTQKADPWSAAQPYLKDIMARAQSVYNANPSSPYPGPGYVGPSLPTELGLMGLAGASQNQAQLLGQAGYSINNLLNGSDPFMQQLTKTAGGDYLHGSPELDALYGSMSSRVRDQVASQFSAAGRYGSGKYADALGRSLGDLNSQIYANNYTAERGNQLNAAQHGVQSQIQASAFIPALSQAQNMPAETLLKIGSADEGYQNLALQDLISKFQQTQQAPWNDLAQYNAIVQGFGGLGSSSTSSTTQPGVSPLAGILGGVSGGLGILGQLGGLFGGGAAAPAAWALGNLFHGSNIFG